MSRVNFLLIAVVFSVLFLHTIQQTCSYAYQQNIRAQYDNYINSINETHFDQVAFGVKLSQLLDSVTKVCFPALINIIQATRNVERRIRTNSCVYDRTGATSAEWHADPCCNKVLEQTQCCVNKYVNVTYVNILSFKPNADTLCAHPLKAKQLTRAFVSQFQRRLLRCNADASEDIIEQTSLIDEMGQCFVDLYQKPRECRFDSQCNQFSNGTCSSITNKCTYGDVSNPNPLLDCIFSRVPDHIKRGMINKLGLKNADGTTKIREEFKNLAAPFVCLKPDGTANLTATTQAECEAEKVCNVPGLPANNCTPQATTDRCYTGCNPINGVCNEKIGFLNQQVCQTAGLCVGHGYLVPGAGFKIFDRETCQNGTFKSCSNFAECGDNCNATACAATSKCLGAPATAGCLKPFEINLQTNQKFCNATTGAQKFFEIGCFTPGGNQQTCEASKGRFIPKITTKTECESIKSCYNPERRQYSLMSPSQCTACNNQEVQAFTWAPAVWGTPPFIPTTKVVTPALVSKNKWIRALEFNRLGNVIKQVIDFTLFPVFKTYAQCLFGAVMPALETFACDCEVGKQHNTTNCYPTKLTVEAGSLKAFSGLRQAFKQFEYAITVKNNSITKDSVFVNIRRVVQDNVQPAAYYDKYDIFFRDTLAQTGAVVSSGFQVSTADGSPFSSINLCIEIDQDAKAALASELTTPGIATVDASGNVANTGATITNTDTDSQLCFDTSSSGTYYAAFFGTNTPGQSPKSTPTTPTTSKTPASGSVKFGFTIFSMIACIIVALF